MTKNLNERHISTENEKTTENYKELLDSLRLEVVMNLDIQRQFIFSYLISKKVLDDEDCEQILNSGVTRQQKVSCFIDIIRRKGPSGIKHFIDALEFDNPALYKAFTGKNATAFIAPLIPSGRAWDCISGLSAKEYIDSDRAMLSNQLEQRIKDYHCMVVQLNKSIEEKNIVEKKLMEAQLKIDQLQHSIENLKAFLQKNPNSNDERNLLLLKLQEEEIRLKYYDKMAIHDNYVINLQSKLLAQTEEISEKNNQCNHLKEENKKIKRMVDEVRLKFSLHRKIMKKYSEHNFNANSSSTEEIKEMQLKFQRTADELELLREEHGDFVTYSDMLNTKYKMLLSENSDLKERNLKMSCLNESMALENEQTKLRLNEMEWKHKCLEDQNARLEISSKMYQDIKSAQKFEIDRLLEEKDKVYDAIANSKRKTDEGLRKQILINEALEENYRKVTNELDAVKITLQQTLKELDDAKSLLKLESQNITSECMNEEVVIASTEISTKDNGTQTNKNDIESLPTSESFARKRSSKELLNSLRRKFPEDSCTRKQSISDDSSVRSLFSFQQIRLLFPTYLNPRASDHICISDYSKSLPNLPKIENLNDNLSKIESNGFMRLASEDKLNTNSPVFRRRAMLVEEKDRICRAVILRKVNL